MKLLGAKCWLGDWVENSRLEIKNRDTAGGHLVNNEMLAVAYIIYNILLLRKISEAQRSKWRLLCEIDASKLIAMNRH